MRTTPVRKAPTTSLGAEIVMSGASGTTSPKTFWERVARTRWGAYITRHEEREFVGAVALAEPASEALEIGAEGGRWAMKLRQRGWRLTCTDVDPAVLAVCQERIPEARCIVVHPDDTRFPVDDASVRLLVIIEVEPVTEAAWFPREAVRVLEPGGVLIATLGNPVSARAAFHRMLCRRGLRKDKAYMGPSYAAFRRALRARGLHIAAERGLTWFPFTRQSNSRLIPAAEFLERLLGLSRLPTLSPLVIVTARKPEHNAVSGDSPMAFS
jgi:SAM-dependent methyltransferase